MTTDVKPSASLESWREYFKRGDSDIFGIIEHAIMVAAADVSNEFISRRGRIAELLYSCKLIGCDHSELAITEEEAKTVEMVRVDKEDENKGFVDEIMRIKRILLNKEQSNIVVLEYLRRLESMSMSVDVLEGTEIGKAVNSLRKHSSDKISTLAKTLYIEWKEMAEKWIDNPKAKEIADTKGTPESANLSVLDEEIPFPSPPLDFDFDIFGPEPNGFEFSQFFDGLDCDGNELPLSFDLDDSLEPKHEIKLVSSGRRKTEGTNEANVVERHNKDQKRKREEADVRPMKHSATVFDERRRQPKQSREQEVHVSQRKPLLVVEQKRKQQTREQMVPASQRKPLLVAQQKRKQQTRQQMVPASQRKRLVVVEQKRKFAGSQQDASVRKLEDIDPDTRFEFAKRKLQESYQQHENAKRQRTIQVLETIPKPGRARKPQLKRPVRR